jgi:hypothetical protein
MEGRPGTLPLVVMRHGGPLIVAAALLYGAGKIAPAPEQPAIWLVAAAAAGVMAGLVDRGWLGMVFVGAGIVLGMAIDLATRYHSTDEAAVALATAAWLYLATVLVGAVAYLVVRTLRRLIDRQGPAG